MRCSLLVAAAVAVLAAVPTATAADPPCDRACEIAAVDAYLDAIVSHDASAVPFAPNARRIENSMVTGRSGEGLRRDLDRSPKYRIIEAIRDKRFVVEGDQVVVYFLIDTAGYPGGPQILTSQVAERFRLADGQITEIEAIISIVPGKLRTGWR